jgi:hypothetical protein
MFNPRQTARLPNALRCNGFHRIFHREDNVPKTTAERQAAYRARQSNAEGDGKRRVSVWLSTGCALALGRLARRYGVTQQALLERMLLAEDERILATIASDSAEWSEYFGVAPLVNNFFSAPPSKR